MLTRPAVLLPQCLYMCARLGNSGGGVSPRPSGRSVTYPTSDTPPLRPSGSKAKGCVWAQTHLTHPISRLARFQRFHAIVIFEPRHTLTGHFFIRFVRGSLIFKASAAARIDSFSIFDSSSSVKMKVRSFMSWLFASSSSEIRSSSV